MGTDYRKREIFSEYMINKIIGSMSGDLEEEKYCKFNKPSDKYSIGSLSPMPNEINNEDFQTDFYAKYSPYSLGVEFMANKISKDSIIQIFINFNAYYRVFPNWNQQNEIESRSFVPIFKRIRFRDIPVRINVSEVQKNGELQLNLDKIPDLKTALNEIYQQIKEDPYTYRENKEVLSIEKLTSEINYNNFYSSLSNFPKAIPDWDFELRISMAKTVQGSLFKIMLINKSDPNFIKTKIYEPYIFNVFLKIEVTNGEIVPFTFNQLEESYRYNREMWGVGINCHIVKNNNTNKLITENVPIYRQFRYGTREEIPGLKELAKAKFDKLTDDPISTLEKIKNEMIMYKEYCLLNPNDFIDKNSLDYEKDKENFEKNLAEFDNEIKRFENGIHLLIRSKPELSKYHSVYEAFQYMNETFSLSSKWSSKKFDSWRTFQIVFIVSNLIDVAEQNWPGDFKEESNVEKISVLWFPTGGGKTEAYLGLTVFNLFFDRLRNKKGGVTALFRFPLRILSLQQFQRIFNIVYFANKIKQKHNISGAPFSVGHWVGSNQTPNNIEQPGADWKNDIKTLQKMSGTKEEMEKIQSKLRRVKKCPKCGNDIEVYWDDKFKTVMHMCNNKSCTYNHIPLPIYITDTDIYRYLPSVIVSTVDKIATAGMQKSFANILGDVICYSKNHGYSWKDEKDWDDKKIISKEERKLLRPTLQIQDELHLLKEDLGAYDSHYETMIQEMLRQISGNYAWKIIASTATIQDFNRHISHLYGKEERHQMSIRFPVEGPNSDESFYSAKTKDNSIGRYFVGIMGHNKTHINTIVEVIYHYHREIKELRSLSYKDFAFKTKVAVSSQEEMNNILDDYEISLNYVLTKRNGDQIAESISSQIGDYLREDNLTQIVNEMLTGGTTPDQLFEILEKVETDYINLNEEERLNSITATSMISHGVDVDRFNFMIFFGMPRQTAEYIQASSRVGRRIPGITIDVFAPQKERDQSFYKYFQKYHEYIDRLVEAPAINRWAKFSIEKTFPGLLLGHVLHKYNRKYGINLINMSNMENIYLKLSREEVKRIQSELSKILKSFYVTSISNGDYFDFIVDDKIKSFIESLRKIQDNSAIKHLSYVFRYPPMRSLRDTEEDVLFSPTGKFKEVIAKIEF